MYLKIAAALLMAGIILIQFLGPSLPETVEVNSFDLIKVEQVPPEVAGILQESCYDCHSMQTHFPWYSHVAPVKWLITHDINWGRGGVNFSEWGNYKNLDRIKYLGEIGEVIEDDEMPLPIYTLIHPAARLSEEEKKAVLSWTESAAEAYFTE